MISFITDAQDPRMAVISDDPVRPELSADFRVEPGRFILVLEDGGGIEAAVCVSLHDHLPRDVEELTEPQRDPDIAIFYTIWSYEKGAGSRLLKEALSAIQRAHPEVRRFVTMSPKTEMARNFHLKNGAVIAQENETSVNYEYVAKG